MIPNIIFRLPTQRGLIRLASTPILSNNRLQHNNAISYRNILLEPLNKSKITTHYLIRSSFSTFVNPKAANNTPESPIDEISKANSVNKAEDGSKSVNTGKDVQPHFDEALVVNGRHPKPQLTGWQSDKVVFKSLLKYIWPKEGAYDIKLKVLLALSFLAAGKILNVNVPIFFKSIVDCLQYSPGSELTILTGAGAMLIGYGASRLGSFLFQELRNAVFSSVAQRAIRAAAGGIFDHVQHLDMNFHVRRQTGGLVRAIDRGTKGINQILSALVLHIIPTLMEMGMVCGILTYNFGWTYAAATVATVSSYAFFTFWVTVWRAKFRRQMNAADNRAASAVTDTLMNIESVKSYTNEAFELKRYDSYLKQYEESAIRSTSSLAFLNAGQQIILSIALTAMMWMSANGIINGAMTIGDLVMVNGLVFQLSVPLNFLGTIYRETRQSLIDIQAMFNLKGEDSTVIKSKVLPQLCLQKKGGEIIFENVSFTYANGRPILRNVSFSIPAGSSVALVGPSGCGKSTFLRLLLRFYEPSHGHIYIDGQDITQLNLESLRKNIGIVPQDVSLFNKTIFDNIKYGKPDATDEEVYEAARLANIHAIIKTYFPEGYSTHVGERGLMISGGEKQRIQLARAFLKNPPIILFDEPTSALDQRTESVIMKTVFNFLRQSHPSIPSSGGDENTKRTAIFIAHRLRTIKECDKIIVLDKGVVVEQGSHEELLAHNDVYAKMWEMQESGGK